MILGVHCDVRQGYVNALRQAEALDCGAMQILTYRRHHVPTEDEFAAFRAAFAASALERLVLHVRYLPALASEDAERRARSIELLATELRYARALGGNWLILHMGAYSPDANAADGMQLFADGICAALERAQGGVPLVLENVPGGGRRMGGSLEELAALGERLARRNTPLRFCLDTAHAWSYGYDLDTREGMWRFLGRAHRLFGADNIPVFHLNDSRAPHGSKLENHRHWGEGFLGTEGMRALFQRAEYRGATGILEMPPGRDAENLAYVRGLSGD